MGLIHSKRIAAKYSAAVYFGLALIQVLLCIRSQGLLQLVNTIAAAIFFGVGIFMMLSFFEHLKMEERLDLKKTSSDSDKLTTGEAPAG